VLQLAPRIFGICISILTVVFFIYHGLHWQDNFFVPTIGFSIFGIASAALIAMTLRPQSFTQTLFKNRVLRFFGKYSYGLYVYHYSIDQALAVPLRHIIDNHFHSKALGVLLTAMVVFVLSILIALLSFHFFESRFLRLKRYFSYNRSAQPLSAKYPAAKEPEESTQQLFQQSLTNVGIAHQQKTTHLTPPPASSAPQHSAPHPPEHPPASPQ
jgi:peptidoglycan/LPS O-acetylase OafA/YrhL